MPFMNKLALYLWVFPVLWFGYTAFENLTTRPFKDVKIVAMGSTTVNNDVAPRVLAIKRSYSVGQSCHIDFIRYIVNNEAEKPGDTTFENSPTGNHELVVQSGWIERVAGEHRDDIINIPIFSAYPAGTYTLYSHYAYRCNLIDYVFQRSDMEKMTTFKVISSAGNQ